MAIDFSGVPPVTTPSALQSTQRTTESEAGDFAGYLLDTLEEARAEEANAEDLAERFANGDPDVGIHEVMIATERAAVSLRYAVNLKNKAIEAYRELMNTPL